MNVAQRVVDVQDPGDASAVLGKEFNISTDKIPTTPGDIETIRDKYLKREWGNVIANNTYVGPVDAFLKENNFIFLILLFFLIFFSGRILSPVLDVFKEGQPIIIKILISLIIPIIYISFFVLFIKVFKAGEGSS